MTCNITCGILYDTPNSCKCVCKLASSLLFKKFFFVSVKDLSLSFSNLCWGREDWAQGFCKSLLDSYNVMYVGGIRSNLLLY